MSRPNTIITAWFFVGLLSWFPLTVRGETLLPPPVCDLHACLDYALKHHPSLQATEARRSSIRSLLEAEQARYRPQLNLGVETGLVYGEPTGAFFLARGVQARKIDFFGRYYSVGAALNYSLFNEGVFAGRPAPSVLQIQGKVEEEDYAEQVTREQIIYGVSQTYYSALKHAESVTAAEEMKRSRELDRQTALRKFQEGLISKGDLLDMEVQLATTEKELQEAHNALSFSLADLATEIGLDPTEKITLRDQPEPLQPLSPVEVLVELSYTLRPEMAMQQAKIKTAQAGFDLARSKRLPTIVFNSAYTVGDDYDPPGSISWLTSLQLTMPLFDSGVIRAHAAEARSKVTEQETGLIQLRHAAGLEVIQAYTEIMDAENRIRLAGKRVERAEERVRSARSRFEKNLVPQSEIFEAEADLLSEKKALIEAQYDQRLGSVKLRKAVGGDWEK